MPCHRPERSTPRRASPDTAALMLGLDRSRGVLSGDDLRRLPGRGAFGGRKPQDLAAVYDAAFRFLPATLRQEFLRQISEAAWSEPAAGGRPPKPIGKSHPVSLLRQVTDKSKGEDAVADILGLNTRVPGGWCAERMSSSYSELLSLSFARNGRCKYLVPCLL